MIELSFVAPDLRRLDEVSAEVVACGVFRDERPFSGLAGLLDWRLAGRLSRLAKQGFLAGDVNEVVFVPARPRLPFEKLLAFGLGPRASFDEKVCREVLKRVLDALDGLVVKTALIELPGRSARVIEPEAAAEILFEILGDSDRDGLSFVDDDDAAKRIAKHAVDRHRKGAASPRARAAEERDRREDHPMKLDLELGRKGVPPKEAATLILVRPAADGIEVFCVQRNVKSAFMGGAIVFPGGKLDPSDEWNDLFSGHNAFGSALSIAACRESLEEAAILPVKGRVSNEDLADLRKKLEANPQALREFLAARGLVLDLDQLHPFSRWVTPEAEAPRRFDAKFFLTVAPEGQSGAHDEYETVTSFWATPAEILRRFELGEVALAPPTHRTLEILAKHRSTDEAIAYTKTASLEPIMPILVPARETMALVLPGDPEHDVKEKRTEGATRFVRRGERWLPE